MTADGQPELVDVLISLDDASLEGVTTVLDRLRQVGLEVKGVMEDIGVIAGSIESSRLQDLHQVEGVSGVEVSREFQIPPPDSDVQ